MIYNWQMAANKDTAYLPAASDEPHRPPRHALEGRRVQTREGKVYTVGRVVRTRFGLLATDKDDPKWAYQVRQLVPVGTGD